MTSKYDEDVYENPYFLKIMSDHPGYLDRVATSKGVLCVPKYSIASSLQPSVEDIEDHILLPTKDVVDDDDDFITLSKKIVKISDSKLVTKEGFPVVKQVPILFAETFHTDSGGSYRVFCIDGLLNRAVDKASSKDSHKVVSPTSYRQCLELLWSNSGGHKMRDSLDRLLNTFAATYDRLEGETLRSIVDVANTHFTKAMQLLLKDSVVRRSVQRNPHYMDNLKVAVETYVMNSVHKHLFRVLTTTMAGHDSEINKINRNLIHLQFSDLGIRKIFSQNLPAAKKELNLLNKYSTPLGRLFCIKRVVAALTRPPKSQSKESSRETVALMTTDDLLPILVFLIIKSEIPNWMANLVYMRHFHFAKSSDDDEFGFYLASVEAALEHIKSGNIGDDLKLLKPDQWNSLMITDSVDSPLSSSPSAGSPTSLSPSRQICRSSIDDFFKFVQEGNEKMVQQMLERPFKTSEEVHLKLCHPLCSCDKCDKLLSDFRSNSDLVTAYTRDSRGYTALHMAAYYGQARLIDLLVQNHAVVDATDYLGLTPLHLACQRGYQNVMLLLLHFGADVISTDNEGNTPLHLCCANGHEDCVKALVFYEASMKRLQINVANEFGDTPLHLAAKWGYEVIVTTLLENGADARLCNRKKQTPVSLAQNVRVQRSLQLAAEDPESHLIRPQEYDGYVNETRSRSQSTSSIQSVGHPGARAVRLELYEPEMTASTRVETASLELVSESELRRKQEKLFKAVIEGDIQLVKFYLGIQHQAEYGQDAVDRLMTSSMSANDTCHPLCQCDKCRRIHKARRKSGEFVSVNAKTSTGYSPIHVAVLHNHSDIVALLISRGADVSAQNHKSLTPLHLAVCNRNSPITDMLVKAEARLNVHDINGDTPLLIAASSGFVEGAQILIQQATADLNATNHRGNTALHEAVIRGHLIIATALLRAGADPRIRNKQGRLPLDDSKDQSMQAILQTAAFTLESAEKMAKNNNNLPNKQPARGVGTKVSIRELFAAFEDKDVQTLQHLAASIRAFDRKGTLRRTQTKDMSAPSLDVIAQKHLIQSFDKGTLRTVNKVKSLNLRSLFKSKSLDTISPRMDSSPSGESFVDDELLTPMGDNSFESFESSSELSLARESNPESAKLRTNAVSENQEFEESEENHTTESCCVGESEGTVLTKSSGVEDYNRTLTSESSSVMKSIGGQVIDSFYLEESEGRHIIDSLSVIESEGKHVTDTSSIIESEVKHLTDTSSVIESEDRHITDNSSIIESEVKHVPDTSSIIDSEDRHVTDTSSIIDSEDRHVIDTSNIIESEVKHVTDTYSVIESVDKHVTDTSSVLESEDRHITDASNVIESAGKHVTDSSSIIESEDRHVTGTTSIIDSEDRRITDSSSVIESVGKNVTDTSSVIESVGKHVTDTFSIIESEGRHVTDTSSVTELVGKLVTEASSVIESMEKHVTDT